MTPPSRPRVRDDLHVVELDGEAVVYDESSGDLHQLNRVATLVFHLCDGTATARDVAGEIASLSDGAPADVERHVRRFIRTMRDAGLIEPSTRSTHGQRT